jgi:polar amino acid transport system permease protein
MHFDWTYFWAQLITPSFAFLDGLGLTVFMSVTAQLLGFIFGLILAFGRLSSNRFLRGAAATYIWVVRGTPLLVQIVFIYSGLAAAGILNFHDITMFGVTFPGNLQAGVLALAVNEAAYMAEIYRAGITAVDRGQFEAAKALGMPPSMMMRHIVLPQAFRIIMLPIGNQFNIMLKNTTLVSVIGVSEMLLVTETINSATFRTFELYSVLAVYFLLLTSLWNLFMGWAERHFALGRPAARAPRGAREVVERVALEVSE